MSTFRPKNHRDFDPKIALNKFMKWQFLTNLGAKIQIHFEFLPVKWSIFIFVSKLTIFQGFLEFVIFG